MLKKFLAFALCLVLLAAFAACAAPAAETGKLSVVVTIFPVYDWVMQVLGDAASDADVTLLLDNGVDLHSYQPTAADLVRLSTCDVFVYIGGESDDWVASALASAGNKQMVAVNLTEALKDALVTEELVSGMQAEEAETEGEEAFDEHIWLSLKNAVSAVQVICEALKSADAAHSDDYSANAETYCADLQALDGEYTAAISGFSNVKPLLVADRFPFRYLAEDYHLSYYAAFAGCSAESEASFETVSFLAEQLNQKNLPAVIILEGSDSKLAQTVMATAGKQLPVLTMNSMQSSTTADYAKGQTYLSLMRANLETLKQALA